MNIETDIFSKIELSFEERRLKTELDDCVLVIKNITDISKKKDKITKYEQFKSKIEKDGSMCLLFIHNSLPNGETPTESQNIYYEYLILKKDGKHDSLCSGIYTEDNQQNRLNALESFYYKFNIEGTPDRERKERLNKMYLKYNNIYNELVEKIFKRMLYIKKNSYNIRTRKYTDTDIIYEQLELKILPSREIYQSNCYPHLTFKNSTSTFAYERINLFLIYLKSKYG